MTNEYRTTDLVLE